MKRETTTFPIKDLRSEFLSIDFPEYQREPTVWNREQKQRLIDSILRGFDIAAVYFYEREDSGWECIDGRQRLNAIMSFLGENESDEDNGFSLRIQNEVADVGPDELAQLEGLTFRQLEGLENFDRDAILAYDITLVLLSGSRDPTEFNLQFLRLNLGTLINAGEKLHAMVGVMRDLLFDSARLGLHPFLSRVGVPTRRYARELIAAQIMLQVSTKAATGDFARARHFDLQRYVKLHSETPDAHTDDVSATLDALEMKAADLAELLGNRAICVSVVLAAWELRVKDDFVLAARYGEFVHLFLERLAHQARRMRQFNVDPHYPYLVEFQRHLTQAAVEKPAVAYRHLTLMRQFEVWSTTGGIEGDLDGPSED
jgi:hypothetical protein